MSEPADEQHVDLATPAQDEGSLRHEPDLTITEQELVERLGWFTRVRWLMAGGTLVLLLFCWYGLGVRFHVANAKPTLGPAIYVALLIFIYNAVFTVLVRRIRHDGAIRLRRINLIALGQIACDMIAVTALVHHTGGVANYFVILVLLPMVIASELLPQSLAYLCAAGAAALINAMAWGEYTGLLAYVHVDLSGGRGQSVVSGLHADWVYVLQVTGAMSAMSFMMVFIASAISTRLRLREHELADAYRRLHDADEAKSFFMRKAGHEMRAPLAAIVSILDAVAQDGQAQLTDQQRRLMNRAALRSKALMEMVNDLRRYARLRAAPRDVLRTGYLALDDLAGQVIELLGTHAAAAGLSLTARVEPVPVTADEELIKQVVINLVTNAIQYTPEGGSIEVVVRADEPWAVLEVADTGIGLSETARRHLFEEFYRSPEAKKTFRDGTGLGLSICKRIIDIHGGQISAQSQPGGGSIFAIRLPLAATCPVDKPGQ
jgi:signal transduction histidine kinase